MDGDGKRAEEIKEEGKGCMRTLRMRKNNDVPQCIDARVRGTFHWVSVALAK